MIFRTSPSQLETVIMQPSSLTLTPSRQIPSTIPLISCQIMNTPCSELFPTSMSLTLNVSYLKHPCQPKSLSTKATPKSISQLLPTLQDPQLSFLFHCQVLTFSLLSTTRRTNQSFFTNTMGPSNRTQQQQSNSFSMTKPAFQ